MSTRKDKKPSNKIKHRGWCRKFPELRFNRRRRRLHRSKAGS